MHPSMHINFCNFTMQNSVALYGESHTSPPTLFLLDYAEQTKLQIFLSKCLKPVETGLVP